MSYESLLALGTFAFVTSITPGPNNLMLLASGMNHGFARTVPHMLGISVGFFAMCMMVGLGLGTLFARYPGAHTALRWAGTVYLLYLAWRIATTRAVTDAGNNDADGHDRGRPLTLWEAALFQWVNPKAWAMALSAFSTYLPADAGLTPVLGVSTLFTAVNLPCVSSWALFGMHLRRWLQSPRHTRAFNIAMALLLLASLALFHD